MTNLISPIKKFESQRSLGVKPKPKKASVLELDDLLYLNDYIKEYYSYERYKSLLIDIIKNKYTKNPKRKYFPRLLYQSEFIDENFQNKSIDLKHKTSIDINDIVPDSNNSFDNNNIIKPHNKSSSPVCRFKEYKDEEKKDSILELERPKIKDFNLGGLYCDNIKEISTNFNNNLIDHQNSNFLDFLKFDLKRKIKFADISFDSSTHDIYNPKFDSPQTSHESNSKHEKEHFNFSLDANNNEQHGNSNLNIISSILSSSEFLSLQGGSGGSNNELNIKQDYILVNQIDEKSISSSKHIKIKNPLAFPINEYSEFNSSKKKAKNSSKFKNKEKELLTNFKYKDKFDKFSNILAKSIYLI